MTDALRVFISHKMPTDTPLAEAIGGNLALYAGNQLVVSHAGTFRYGEKWREKIEEELDKADWLIFLATGQNEDWAFCLYECGYFISKPTRPDGSKKRLTTFCRKGDQVQAALEPFNALQISVEAVMKLLNEIYIQEPYAINPKLPEDVLQKTATDIVTIFEGGERVERNFDVAPSISIELLITDVTRSQLRSGTLPRDCPVTGLKDWQRLFGKSIDTGAWLWSDLRKDWPFVEAYEYLLAKMILDALEGKEPAGAIFRVPQSDDLFRMTLRRFERVSGDKHRFHFTAGLVDLPFDLLQAGSSVEETVLYHLVNLTWYFRRRVVDKLYRRVLELKSVKNPSDALINELYDDLGRELMLVVAQSIMRKIDNPLIVQDALGKTPRVRELLKQADSFQGLQKAIFEAMGSGALGLNRIADDLFNMAMQNHAFYNVAASRYSALAKKLPQPQSPNSEKE